MSIYRRGKTWYAKWQKDGHQYRRSLQTRNKKEAILRAQRIEQEIDQDSGVTRVEPARVEQVIGEYLAFAQADGRAKKTLAKYRQVCDQIRVEAGDKTDYAWTSSTNASPTRFEVACTDTV